VKGAFLPSMQMHANDANHNHNLNLNHNLNHNYNHNHRPWPHLHGPRAVWEKKKIFLFF